MILLKVVGDRLPIGETRQTGDLRFENQRACVDALDCVFKLRMLAEWMAILEGFAGVWAPVLKRGEVQTDAQVLANSYLAQVVSNAGVSFKVVGPPMQFNQQPAAPRGPAPELDQHSKEVLLECGLNWDEIAAAREAGALG